MLKKFSCPACGVDLFFKSNASLFKVCEYCSSTVVRQDLKIELIGKQAEVGEAFSVLQLGTMGRYKGSEFSLIGYCRWEWSHGFWNEWYAQFDDGQTRWLAEAQGTYAISESAAPLNTQIQQLKLEQQVSLADGTVATVSDIKTSRCTKFLGELPFRPWPQKERLSVDFSFSNSNKFASMDFYLEETSFYVGEYLEFEELSLSHLKEIDGWS